MNLIAVQQGRKGAHDPIEAARDWLEEFGEIALATVVSTWGSSPVPVGGQLVAAPGELFEGSVSGGCIEIDVIGEAAEVMATRQSKLLEFGIEDEVAWRSGLPCGGTLKILLEPLGRADAGYIDAILAARRARTTLGILTDLTTGARQILDLGAAAQEGAGLEEALRSGQSRLMELPGGEAFLHVLAPPVRVVAIGATQIAQVLADLAGRIGYDVVIVDPRTAFASEMRFAGMRAVTEWPEASLETLGLDARTAIVALTHAAHLDDEALGIALRSDCLYIGALGSKKTQAGRRERLRALGFTDAELDRIHAPVGLAIGAKGPAEIALSILAEIVKVARGAA